MVNCSQNSLGYVLLRVASFGFASNLQAGGSGRADIGRGVQKAVVMEA